MFTTLTTLISILDTPALSETSVLKWGSPVPSFGNLSVSKVASLGLNPSSREFMDSSGNELYGTLRRFHTLNSLGLESWSDVDARHLQLILDSCRQYFFRNPYNGWFKRLDQVISGTRASYYSDKSHACHLDLIPYATEQKWAELSPYQRSTLLSAAGDSLASLLLDSPVQILILNGSSVINHFVKISDVFLEKEEMLSWSLPRRSMPPVTGHAVRGILNSLSGINLGREILVLGFNHNLQSSFGVTNSVIKGIQSWIAQSANEVF